MSFDIHSYHFVHGQDEKYEGNELVQIRELFFQMAETVQEAEGEWFDLCMPDKGSTNISGTTFFIYNMSPQLAALVYRVAIIGYLTLIPTWKHGPLIFSEAQRDDLPDGDFFAQAIICHDEHEAILLFCEGFEGFSRYRDFVLGKK